MSNTESITKKYFEVRSYPNQKDQYTLFIKDNIICLGWPSIGDLSTLKLDKNRKYKIKNRLQKAYPNLFKNKPAYLTQVATFFIRFLDMREGDIILIPRSKESKLSIATVSSSYHYNDTAKYKTTDTSHQVGIQNVINVNMDTLSKSLKNRLRARLTLTLIGEDKHDEINRLYKLNNVDKDIQHNKNNIFYTNSKPTVGYSTTSKNNTQLLFNNQSFDIKNKKAFLANLKMLKKTYDNAQTTDQTIDNDQIELIKKSLLLSAFSLAEGYLHDILEAKIDPSQEGINNKENIKTFDDMFLMNGKTTQLKQISNGFKEKYHVFKSMYEVKYPKKNSLPQSINYLNNFPSKLRNNLAHDITSATFSEDGGVIVFQDNKNEEQKVKIDQFFENLSALANDANI